jgi:hypothetical protein
MAEIDKPADFPTVQLETDEQGNIKDFQTSLHRYRVIKIGQPLGPARFTAWQKLSAVYGLGKNLASIAEGFKQIVALATADKPLADIRRDIILTADSYMKGVTTLSRERYHMAFYVFSVFCYREGDNPAEWSEAEAERNIEDWSAHMIDEEKVLFFSVNRTHGMAALLNHVQNQRPPEFPAV